MKSDGETPESMHFAHAHRNVLMHMHRNVAICMQIHWW